MEKIDTSTQQKRLTAEQTDAGTKILNDMLSQMVFFRDILAKNCDDETVETHLSLIQHKFDDLAVTLGQSDMADQKYNRICRMLRNANKKIAELQSEIGNQVGTEAALARIKEMQSWFETWYSLSGFHYVSIEEKLNGFYADFSNEIDIIEPGEDRTEITFGSKQFAIWIFRQVPYLFHDGYKLRDEQFHKEILDCDSNKEALKTLIETTFPGANVMEFHGRIDNKNKTSLRMKAYIPYAGVTAWHDSILEKARQAGDRYKCGKLYVRKTELKSQLRKEHTFRKHASASMIKEAEAELEKIQKITEL